MRILFAAALSFVVAPALAADEKPDLEVKPVPASS
jgi:hypothetical protein